jgi:hypothetical protein
MGGAGRRGDLATTGPGREPGAELPNSSDSGSDVDEDRARVHVPRHKRPLPDIETWFDYWSEELATTYHVLIEQCEQYGYAFLENCTFNKFVEFTYENSSKCPPPC